MRSTRIPLGILIVAPMLVALSPAGRTNGRTLSAAQAGAPTACSIIDPAELQRVTGRKDGLKRGPISDDTPSRPGRQSTGCGYLQFIFELTTATNAAGFEETRKFLVRGGAKEQNVSGVGDAAFYWWDPRPGSTRPVGIVLRKGTSELAIFDMVSSDSIEIMKPQVLAVAKALAPKLR